MPDEKRTKHRIYNVVVIPFVGTKYISTFSFRLNDDTFKDIKIGDMISFTDEEGLKNVEIVQQVNVENKNLTTIGRKSGEEPFESDDLFKKYYNLENIDNV